jgi:ACS family hexuronate transporter-like MFS transporter
MWKKRRWLLAGLMFLAGIVNYMDRSALSIAAPVMSTDLSLSPVELGYVFSSFFFGYAIFNFVGGLLADRLGPFRVMSIAMGVWSVFCAATAFAGGFVSLLVIRVIFGVGEGPFSTTLNRQVANWFPRKEVGAAVGITNGGTPLGGAIAGPLVGFCVITFGWRPAFVIVGIFGLIWLAAWLLLASNDPETDPRVSAAERQEILSGRPHVVGSFHGPGLLQHLLRPIVLATAFAFFGYNYILFFFISWFPSYLTMARHLSMKDMSLVTVIPWVLGCVGLVGGGFLVDFVYRRTGNALFSRKIVLVCCLGAAAVAIALAGQMTTATSAVALVAVTIFALYLTGSTYWAIVQDAVPRENVGGVGGFVHGLANCSGIIGPTITGYIVQETGSFNSAFALAGAIAVVGVLGVLVFVREPAVPKVPQAGAVASP